MKIYSERLKVIRVVLDLPCSISTISEKVRKLFRRCMQYFIANGGSCNYDAESIGDIEFPLRYRHLVQ